MNEENVSRSKNNHPVKKRRLSLKVKGKHLFQAASDNDLAMFSKPQVPKNTDVSTRWAMKNFTDWYQDYNARNPEEPCPKEVNSPKCSTAVLNRWLVFLFQKQEMQYPPSSLYLLLTGILWHMYMYILLICQTIWLQEFYFLLRLRQSVRLSCLAR